MSRRLAVAACCGASLAFVAAAGARNGAQPGDFLDGVLGTVKKLSQPKRTATRRESAELWDSFLTHIVKQAASETPDPELRGGFFGALIEGRFDVVSVLSAVGGEKIDPLRQLFQSSWPRLAPLFEQLSDSLPSEAGQSWRSLLDAGNALREAGKVGGQLTGELAARGLTPETLRELAALVGVKDPLTYDTALDPRLREVFGFGAPLAGPLAASSAPAAFDWLVAAAHATDAEADGDITALAKGLNGWVPTAADVNAYLPLMRSLLLQTAAKALVAKPLEPRFHALYEDLVLATAWQESCWRQFIRNRKGVIAPIQSGVGSVGLMQINQKVWRGFYDLPGLNQDVAYNAAAGAEILRHYLRDYAVKKGEDTATGDTDNLARATYAVYNGGPGHLRRYRDPKARADLKAIDAAFWAKYQEIKAGGELGVVRCYTDAKRPR
jgi:hypothetical protein